MDREKIINGLQSIKTYLASNAIEATDDFVKLAFYESQKDIDDAIAMLKEQEAVVRCKDCKKRDSWECWQYFFGRIKIPDDWFCADGERKSD